MPSHMMYQIATCLKVEPEQMQALKPAVSDMKLPRQCDDVDTTTYRHASNKSNFSAKAAQETLGTTTQLNCHVGGLLPG